MTAVNAPKPCPVCGTILAATLADAVANPQAPESCPRSGGKKRLAVGGTIPATADMVPIVYDNSYIVPAALVAYSRLRAATRLPAKA